MDGWRPIDCSHFPPVTKHSVLIPGDERIRQNVFVKEPITGMPADDVHTVYDIVRKGMEVSCDGPYIGELRNGEYEWSRYSEVLAAAKHIGCGLYTLECNLKRVGIAGINSLRYTTALHSLVNFSLTAVPLYHNSKMEDLCYIIDSCGLEVVFTDSAERAQTFIDKKNDGEIKGLKTIILMQGTKHQIVNANEVKILEWEEALKRGEAHPHDCIPPSPDDIYVICHTSGTTGRPKGVQTSHGNLVTAVAGLYWQWCPPPNSIPFDTSDVYFSFLSLAHIYEHLMQNFFAYVGGRTGIYSGDVNKLLSDMQILRPTVVALVPRLLNKFYDAVHARIAAQSFLPRLLFRVAKWWKLRLLRNGTIRFDTIWDRIIFSKVRALLGGRVRLLSTGGAPVSPEVKNFTRIAFGALLFEGYGQTECGAAGTLNLPADTTATHVGGPAPWAQMKLIDAPELGYFANEDRGEVCFRGAAVMRGYFGDPALTAKTVDAEGWLHTGDIGMWMANGSLSIIDRKNAFFKLSQGDFVAPELIENIYSLSGLVKQIFIAGRTTRSFLVGIVVVNVDALRTSISNASEKLHHLDTLSDHELVASEQAKWHVISELSAHAKQKGLTSIEIVRNLHLVTEEFTAEQGFLTSTLKIRRHVLTAHYEDIISRLYDEIPHS